MKRIAFRLSLLVAVFSLLLGSGKAFADAATKAAASSATNVFASITAGSTVGPWITVLSADINPPQGFNDLFIDVSMQSAVFTAEFQLFGNGAGAALSIDDAGLQARALVDGVPATPGVVTWDSMFHFLENFSTALNLTDRELVLEGVRSFDFIQKNVGVGGHTVTVQIRFFNLNANFGFAASDTGAVVSARTLTVEGVNLK